MNKERKEIGKIAALALLSQIPVVSAFSKFCEDYVNSTWQERIDLWKEETIKRLSKLDQEIEQKIRKMSNFASILATAQRGALEDIEEDKVGLYTNAVINSIKNEDIDNTKIHIFLNMLRDFSLLHIRILEEISLAKSPTIQIRADRIYVSNSLFRDLRMKYKNKEILEAILKNLSENHVIYIAQNKIGATEPTIITALGKEFLQFIAEQEKSNG